MKFKEIFDDNKLKKWILFKKKYRITLTNIEHDDFLKKELNFISNDILNNAVFFEKGTDNLKYLKKFKGKKYIITYINTEELLNYVKNGFVFIDKSPNICYRYCVWREN